MPGDVEAAAAHADLYDRLANDADDDFHRASRAATRSRIAATTRAMTLWIPIGRKVTLAGVRTKQLDSDDPRIVYHSSARERALADFWSHTFAWRTIAQHDADDFIQQHVPDSRRALAHLPPMVRGVT